MIVDRIEAWQRKGCHTTPERKAWAEKYVADMALFSLRQNFMSAQDGEHEERPDATLSTKTYCARQLHFTLNGAAKEPMEPSAYWKFLIGNSTESAGNATCILAGLPVLSPLYGTSRQMRLTAKRGGKDRRASLDLLIAADLMGGPVASQADLEAYAKRKGPVIVADWKSCSSYSFKEAITPIRHGAGREDWPDQAPLVPGTLRMGNSFGYEDQVLNYAYALEQNGWPVVARLLLLSEKASGDMAEIPVPAWPEQARIAEASYVAAESGLPGRPSWATLRIVNSPTGKVEQIDSARCSYCSVKAVCMPGMERKLVGGRVVYRRSVE